MRPDFSHRSSEHEIMDAGISDFDLFDQSLKQIESVNRLTYGYRPALRWLEEQFSGDKEEISVLDVGSGRGGLLREIWRLADEREKPVALSGIDIALWSATAARAVTPGYMHIDFRTADIFKTAATADYIVCSHMTHHLNFAENVALIRWLEQHAQRGWMIVDLHRHVIPYMTAKLFLLLAPVNPMVRNDGAVSVARAFTRKDWMDILRAAEVPAEIRWHFPFRYGITRMK